MERLMLMNEGKTMDGSTVLTTTSHEPELTKLSNILTGAGIPEKKAHDTTSMLLNELPFDARRQYAGGLLGSSTREVNMLAAEASASNASNKGKKQDTMNSKGASFGGGFLSSIFGNSSFGSSGGGFFG